MTEARAQAADRHTARAVLLEPTPPITIGAPGGGDQAWALARWAGTGAAPRTGEILATLARPLAAWLPCVAGRLRQAHRTATAACPDHRPRHRSRRRGADRPGAIAATYIVAGPASG